jgi:hypothetical protein
MAGGQDSGATSELSFIDIQGYIVLQPWQRDGASGMGECKSSGYDEEERLELRIPMHHAWSQHHSWREEGRGWCKMFGPITIFAEPAGHPKPE